MPEQDVASTADDSTTQETDGSNENQNEKSENNQKESNGYIEDEPKETDTTEKTEEEQKKEGDEKNEEEKKDESKVKEEEFLLKVNGKETKYTKKQVIDMAQKGAAAEERFQEAATIRDNISNALRFAKEKPEEFLQKLDINPKEWAEEYLYEQYKFEEMTPEQKKTVELERENQKYKQMLKEREEQEIETLKQKYTDEIIGILSTAKLPTDQTVIQRAAAYLSKAKERGLDITEEELAGLIREDLINEAKKGISLLSKEDLYNLGYKEPEKPKFPENKVEKEEVKQTTSPKKQKKITWDEFREDVESKFR